MRALRRLAVLAALGGLGFLAHRKGVFPGREFRLSGSVTLSSHLIPRAPKDRSVLFIIVKNKGGVPVALKRIVNPHFPVRFDFETSDLLVPELRQTSGLMVVSEMNTHGSVGQPKPGDLGGEHPDPVFPGQRNVHIVIDRLEK